MIPKVRTRVDIKPYGTETQLKLKFTADTFEKEVEFKTKNWEWITFDFIEVPSEIREFNFILYKKEDGYEYQDSVSIKPPSIEYYAYYRKDKLTHYYIGRVNLNDFSCNNKYTEGCCIFYIGFTLEYKGKYFDFSPIRVRPSNGYVYSEWSSIGRYYGALQDTVYYWVRVDKDGTWVAITKDSSVSPEDFFKMQSTNIYDLIKDLDLKEGSIYELTAYMATWFGYDGKYMKGLYCRDTATTYLNLT